MWACVITLSLDLVLNVAVCVGITTSSPLFISLGIHSTFSVNTNNPGTLLTIPISILVDKFMNGTILKWPGFFGVAFIVIGFVLMNLAEEIGFMRQVSCGPLFK